MELKKNCHQSKLFQCASHLCIRPLGHTTAFQLGQTGPESDYNIHGSSSISVHHKQALDISHFVHINTVNISPPVSQMDHHFHLGEIQRNQDLPKCGEHRGLMTTLYLLTWTPLDPAYVAADIGLYKLLLPPSKEHVFPVLF